MGFPKNMNKIAIIGGSLVSQLHGFVAEQEVTVNTPFGEHSCPLYQGYFGDKEIIFLDRHGKSRTTPPHKINYRANMWALHALGVQKVLGLSIVGGIRSDMTPGHFVFPDQIIDYTYARPSSFFEDDFDFSRHIDFTHPYCQHIHKLLIEVAQNLGLDFSDDATYGVTQGPRFETIAEINRLERDGCDVVGMTAMPEAALARELNMAYASIALVGTKAAGKSDGLYVNIEDIKAVIEASMQKMYDFLHEVVKSL